MDSMDSECVKSLKRKAQKQDLDCQPMLKKIKPNSCSEPANTGPLIIKSTPLPKPRRLKSKGQKVIDYPKRKRPQLKKL